MSASMSLSLDSLLFPSIFLGLVYFHARRTHSNLVNLAGCPSGIDYDAILFRRLDATLLWHK